MFDNSNVKYYIKHIKLLGIEKEMKDMKAYQLRNSQNEMMCMMMEMGCYMDLNMAYWCAHDYI